MAAYQKYHSAVLPPAVKHKVAEADKSQKVWLCGVARVAKR
jgi:hypothetical protein